MFPSDKDIDFIAEEALNADPSLKKSEVKYSVRHWFRKQREYMRYRINVLCNDQLKAGRQNLDELYMAVMSDEVECDRVASECKVEVEDKEQRIRFVREKVTAFYERVLSVRSVTTR